MMTHPTVPAMVTALLLSHNALAGEFGTFEEARELLNRATAAVKADKQLAFEKINVFGSCPGRLILEYFIFN